MALITVTKHLCPHCEADLVAAFNFKTVNEISISCPECDNRVDLTFDCIVAIRTDFISYWGAIFAAILIAGYTHGNAGVFMSLIFGVIGGFWAMMLIVRPIAYILAHFAAKQICAREVTFTRQLISVGDVQRNDQKMGEMYLHCPRCGEEERINDMGKLMLNQGNNIFANYKCKICGLVFDGAKNIKKQKAKSWWKFWHKEPEKKKTQPKQVKASHKVQQPMRVSGEAHKESKGECEHCKGHLAFPAEGTGTVIDCPHCGQRTTLRATGA